MKSVTFSAVLPARAPSSLPGALADPRFRLAVTLAFGLPALMLAFHVFAPGVPLAYIVGPVLAGGLLPLLVAAPARFEIRTRFEARHILPTLDDTLGALGYLPEPCAAGGRQRRYRWQRRQWPGWNEGPVTVTVHAHALELAGPVTVLREVQRRMAC